MSIKFKMFLIFVLLILIALFGCGIYVIDRFKTINDLCERVDSNLAKNNYKIETVYKDSKTETYYKDGVGKFVSDNGIYTWADQYKAYYINEEEKTAYKVDNTNEDLTTGLVSRNILSSLIPFYSESKIERFLFAANIYNKISTEQAEGEECYRVTSTMKGTSAVKTTWISKKYNAPVKVELKFTDSTEVLSYKYKVRYAVVKPDDVKLPNLKEYTVYDYVTNEVLNQISNEKDEVEEEASQLDAISSEVVETTVLDNTSATN